MMKEKTNRKSVAPRKVKGTVLFTVVCVMMVLIVFLLGTLALAATANKRANYSFQKEQTETIARTVLNSVADAINADTSGSPTGINATVSGVTKASPVTMQVELDGRTYPVTVRAIDNTRTVYDSYNGGAGSGSWVTCDMYEITTTVQTLGGNESSETTYSLYMVTGSGSKVVNVNQNDPDRDAFSAPGGINGKMGTGGMTTGGTAIGFSNPTDDGVTYNFDNSADQEGPFYVKGNLTTSSGNAGAKVFFSNYGSDTQKQYMAITGDFTINNPYNLMAYDDMPAWADTDVKDYTEIPCLYVGKAFKTVSNQVRIGSDKAPVNIYCGWIENNIDFVVTGDIYCFEAGMTSKFSGSGSEQTVLQSWEERTFKNIDGKNFKTKFGSIYSKGNIEFQNVPSGSIDSPKYKIEGDVRCEGDIKFTGDGNDGRVVVIGGDLVAKNIEINKGVVVVCKHVYADTVTMYHDPNDAKYNGKITIKNGGSVRDYDSNTDKSTYAAYKDGNGYGAYPPGYTKQQIKDKIIKEPDAAKYDDDTLYPSTLKGFNDNFVKVLDSSNHLDLDTVNDFFWGDKTEGGVTKTDSAHITQSVILSGSSNENLYIDTEAAGGPIAVVIDGFSMATGKSIVVNENGGPVYFFINKDKKFTIEKGLLVTSDYLEKILDKSSISYDDVKNLNENAFGNIQGDMTIDKYAQGGWEYADVFIYGAENTEMTVGGSGTSLVTAHIRAPKTTYTQNNVATLGTTGSGKVEYKDDNGTADCKGKSVGVIGQLIAGEINLQNFFGLIHVTQQPGPGGGPGGGGGGGSASKVFTTLYYEYS